MNLFLLIHLSSAERREYRTVYPQRYCLRITFSYHVYCLHDMQLMDMRISINYTPWRGISWRQK